MRLVWRRVPPQDFNHELVWLAVSVAAAGVGAVWLGFRLPWLHCPFLAVTGYPCLTCGSTRCAIAFLHGNFSLAWWWNPLAFVALCAVALFDLYALVALVARSRRLRVMDWTHVEKNAVRIAVIVLIVANWAYLLAHHARY